jgi:hypothetical protein
MPGFQELALIDIALAALAAEALVLAVLAAARGWPRYAAWLPTLLSGAGLMLAVRLALGAAPSWAWASCLAAAGLAHAVDLRLRWRSLRRPE